MIKKMKRWLCEHFLPMWAKETVLAENKRLQREVSDLRQKLEQQESYIAGLQAGMRSRQRIIINTAEEKK